MDNRLYRSRRNRIIGGVAGGIAESLGVDPTIVRIVWVILALATPGIGLLLYFILLFVIPEAPNGVDVRTPGGGSSTASGGTGGSTPAPERTAWRWDPPATGGGRSGGLVLGIILVLVGAWFLLRQLLPVFDIDLGWPFIALVVGIVLVVVSVAPRQRP